jgi:hypothetical protein
MLSDLQACECSLNLRRPQSPPLESIEPQLESIEQVAPLPSAASPRNAKVPLPSNRGSPLSSAEQAWLQGNGCPGRKGARWAGAQPLHATGPSPPA